MGFSSSSKHDASRRLALRAAQFLLVSETLCMARGVAIAIGWLATSLGGSQTL